MSGTFTLKTPIIQTWFKYSLLSLTILTFSVSGSAHPDNTPTRYTVTQQKVTQKLYFSGTVTPIKNIPVLSPTSGVVESKSFHYGQRIKKGQVLLSFNAQKVEDDLRNAQISYLNAKDSFNKIKNWKTSSEVINAQHALNQAKRNLTQSQNKYQQDQVLFKQYGIISQQALEQSHNSYLDAKASYKQAKNALNGVQAQGLGDFFTIKRLTLETAKKKYDSLKQQQQAHVVKAPTNGIILIPTGQNNNSDSSNKKSSSKLNVGSSVTYQEVLMNIGDLSGITVQIQIPEINVNQVKVGQQAVVTSPAFPNITLKGDVVEVSAQASQGSSSLPTFQGIVQVKHIPNQDRNVIKAGMDAKIAVLISANNHLQVPLKAVHQNDQGQSYVNVYQPNTGQSKAQVIQTGHVNINQVVVTHGLKAGDQIILPTSSH